MDRNVMELSGGELQKVAIAACLSRKTDLFLLDEPSAYLDVEERLNIAKLYGALLKPMAYQPSWLNMTW